MKFISTIALFVCNAFAFENSARKMPESQKPKTAFVFTGDTPPLGFWDPMQITRAADEKTLKYVREAELQHGRVAMIASIALPCIETITKNAGIYGLSSSPSSTQLAWLTTFGIFELARMNAGWVSPFGRDGKAFELESSYEPGAVFLSSNADFFRSDNSDRDRLLNVELNNGRLAMLGVAGTLAQELLVNHPMFTM